jgi:hypothetical protein
MILESCYQPLKNPDAQSPQQASLVGSTSQGLKGFCALCDPVGRPVSVGTWFPLDCARRPLPLLTVHCNFSQ